MTQDPAAPPLTRITSSATFSSAHRLHNPERDDDWNRATFGKCNNPFGHGHTYTLEVTVEGPVERQRVRHRALLAVGNDDPRLEPRRLRSADEGLEPGGLDAVVVGDEAAHHAPPV